MERNSNQLLYNQRQGCPLPSDPFNIVPEVLAGKIRQLKELKGYRLGRTQNIAICRWDDSICKGPYDFYQGTPTADNHLQLSGWIQD